MTETFAHLDIPTSGLEWAVIILATFATVLILRSYAPAVITATIAIVGVLGGIVMGQASITVAFALVSILLRVRKVELPPRLIPMFLIQTTVVLSGLFTYQILRRLIESDRETAEANARSVLDFQQAFGFLSEARVQDAVVHGELSMHFFNGFYSYCFLAVTAGVLFWLFFEHPGNFRLYRDCLGISAALAVITIMIFPVAPPRYVAEAGVVDTFVQVGKIQEFANEFAAIPSLHVGWSALSGFVVGRTLGGRHGFLIGILPGSLMMLTVLATGNHYWIDGVIGATFTLVPAILLLRMREAVYVPQPERMRPQTELTG